MAIGDEQLVGNTERCGVLSRPHASDSFGVAVRILLPVLLSCRAGNVDGDEGQVCGLGGTRRGGLRAGAIVELLGYVLRLDRASVIVMTNLHSPHRLRSPGSPF